MCFDQCVEQESRRFFPSDLPQHQERKSVQGLKIGDRCGKITFTMVSREELQKQLEQLEKLMSSRRPSMSKCRTQLVQLKIGLTQLGGLQTKAPLTQSTLDDIRLARSIYETAALLSIKQEDMDGFERHMSQAKTLYLDYSDHIEDSPRQSLMLALNLMRLLAQNRIAEFHTELELVPQEGGGELTEFVLRLEQYLMEGSFAKLQQEVQKVPDSSFELFVKRLMETVRKELADCTEKAYESMDKDSLAKMLMLNTRECTKFCKEREWNVEGRTVRFLEEVKVETMDDVPSLDLIKRTLQYAKELEQIV